MKLFFNEGQENDGWGYTIYLKGTSSLIQKGWTLMCGKVGIINNRFSPILVSLSDCNLISGPFTSAWALKLYECAGILKNVGFYGAGFSDWSDGGFNGDGHPVYLAPSGSMAFDDCSFIGNGGNFQMVNRSWGYADAHGVPQVDKEVQEKITMAFNNCLFSNNAWNPTGNGGGGASQLALYNASIKGTDILITDTVITNTIHKPENSKTMPSARAALTVWNECWSALQKPKPTLVGNKVPNAEKHFGKLILDNVSLRSTEPDRSLIQINGTKEVVFNDWSIDKIGEWSRHVVDIDPDPINPVRATKIDIAPASGTGTIRHTKEGGETVITPVSQGYTWSK